MNIENLINKRRSIRRFQQKAVPLSLLKRCVDAARLAPSGANLQPLEYVATVNPVLCKRIFPLIGWAGYLNWSPSDGESPGGYIVVLKNREIAEAGKIDVSKYDVGMAVENMLLVALAEGISSCVLASVNREKLRELLHIPRELKIELMVAFGYAGELSVVEDMVESIRYYREGEVLRVPKRKLEDVLHTDRF
jgi:nitroreductase